MRMRKDSNYSYLERQKANARNTCYLLGGAGVICLLFGAAFNNGFFLPIGIIALASCAPPLRKWRDTQAGINGEKDVAQTLMRLDDSYALINDLMTPDRGNIDHIVLSPKGVFCIETKNWTGYIRCYRDEWTSRSGWRTYASKSVSRQARANAAHLGELIRSQTNLKVFVHAVIVFTNPSVELRIVQPTVPVLRLGDLDQFISSYATNVSLRDDKLDLISKTLLAT